MQWHTLIGSKNPASLAESEWHGSRPVLGELEIAPLEALCKILAQHTDEDMECFFGLSTIHAQINESFVTKPLLTLPHREFVVFSGQLSAILEDEVAIVVAPSLMWPADRTWYVASEYDFDSTLVGGSEDLIRDLDDSPDLETWIVFPEDSLAEDADKRN
jgi:hypothetical protein